MPQLLAISLVERFHQCFNWHLNPLGLSKAADGFEMVRYADDFVVLCRSQSEAEEALRLITAWVEGRV